MNDYIQLLLKSNPYPLISQETHNKRLEALCVKAKSDYLLCLLDVENNINSGTYPLMFESIPELVSGLVEAISNGDVPMPNYYSLNSDTDSKNVSGVVYIEKGYRTQALELKAILSKLEVDYWEKEKIRKRDYIISLLEENLKENGSCEMFANNFVGIKCAV